MYLLGLFVVFFQAFPDKTLPLGSLPSALRKAMVIKFPDFDKYQLGLLTSHILYSVLNRHYRDHSKIIFCIFFLKTYVVTEH